MHSQKIVFLSTYPPRECGIATFTRDLSEAMHKKFGNHVKASVVAMEENPSSFRVYNKKVFFTINESDIHHYAVAAKKINCIKSAKILNIQHEFGIFGGVYGKNILRLMELVDKKIFTTFHTVLDEPDEDMKRVVTEIASRSEKIIVMTNEAKRILVESYGIPEEGVVVIPHGVPNISFSVAKNRLKKKFSLSGKKILLTFGLLSRGKAVEHVIQAMPSILERHPEAVYIIVGETHPKVREEEGEEYRLELKALARGLGVENSVKFLNQYLSLNHIVEFLKMADVYLAPSLDPRQICSGTVSYAMAAGKPIVSSRSKYNDEVLAGGRGIIVEMNSGKNFAEKVINLLDDAALRGELERNSFEYSRRMTWQNVATHYYNEFAKSASLSDKSFSRLPRLNFRHFYNLTDDFGMIQFADYTMPDRSSGYTLDDNARALLVSVRAYARFASPKMLRAMNTYLGFVERAQTPDGKFHNVADENREFTDEYGSEDSFGRTLCSLGTVLQSNLPNPYKLMARALLMKSIEHVDNLVSPRAEASTVIGLMRASQSVDVHRDRIGALVESLLSRFDANSSEEWRWFEQYLTYANSIIPEAIFEAAMVDGSERLRKVAQDSINFLTRTHFIDGKLVPIGQDGWFKRNEERAFYDQQPIEAAGMTTAYLNAFKTTGNEEYLLNARKSFEWFLGSNSQNQMLYDDSTGGCFDGLTREGVNMNQGAESTISYLNARLAITRQFS